MQLLKPLTVFVFALLVVSLYVGDVAWSPLKLGRNFRYVYVVKIIEWPQQTRLTSVRERAICLPHHVCRCADEAPERMLRDSLCPHWLCSREAILKETHPLVRGDGVVLEVGDFMYSCRPSKAEGACQPTIFYLAADGALVLAKGKSPSKVTKAEELWRSKAPKRPEGEAFTALYSDKGILTVRDAEGRTVWRRRPLFTPGLLRPWPLEK